MKSLTALVLALILAGPAGAQTTLDLSLEQDDATLEPPQDGEMLTTPTQSEISIAAGATLRGLDKINAATTDIELLAGGSARFGDLEVTLEECRYPADNPGGDAYAFVRIHDVNLEAAEQEIFAGWMIASSPALNALDHIRYDVWALRCNTLSGS